MALELRNFPRVFVIKGGNHDGTRLADPNPGMDGAAVPEFYSMQYPELTNHDLIGPIIKNDEQIFHMEVKAGKLG